MYINDLSCTSGTLSSYKSWLEERMGATKHLIKLIWCNVQQILYYSLLSAFAHSFFIESCRPKWRPIITRRWIPYLKIMIFIHLVIHSSRGLYSKRLTLHG